MYATVLGMRFSPCCLAVLAGKEAQAVQLLATPWRYGCAAVTAHSWQLPAGRMPNASSPANNVQGPHIILQYHVLCTFYRSLHLRRYQLLHISDETQECGGVCVAMARYSDTLTTPHYDSVPILAKSEPLICASHQA